VVPDYEDMAVDVLEQARNAAVESWKLTLTSMAQVYATLALVQAVQDLVIPIDGVKEQVELLTNQVFQIRIKETRP
jgi:hypothetical protein